MRDLVPQLLAALFKPVIQRGNIREVRHRLPQTVPGILHVLLYLAFLPTRSRTAERGLEDIMAGHRQKPGIDLPLLAPANAINSRPRSAWPRTHGGQASLS